MEFKSDWQLSKANVFWGEIAPCDHVLQIYEDDNVFLEVLTGFVGDGINAGEGVIIIATAAHLEGLKLRLQAHSINVDFLISQGDYIPLDAEQTLATFMVDGWPDEELFMDVVSNLISKAKKGKRRVRAFGEMVAILWSQGNNGATVNLEHLWNKFGETEEFCLFCAYPKSGFTMDAHESIKHICGNHSRIISGNSVGELFHQDLHSEKHYKIDQLVRTPEIDGASIAVS